MATARTYPINGGRLILLWSCRANRGVLRCTARSCAGGYIVDGHLERQNTPGGRYGCKPIRQGKAKTGMAEELARRIKEGRSRSSRCPGLQGLLVIYAPDDTVTAISIFDDYAGAEVQQARARVDRAEPRSPAHRSSHSGGGPSERAHVGLATRERALLPR